jgi:hypothetical protein
MPSTGKNRWQFGLAAVGVIALAAGLASTAGAMPSERSGRHALRDDSAPSFDYDWVDRRAARESSYDSRGVFHGWRSAHAFDDERPKWTHDDHDGDRSSFWRGLGHIFGRGGEHPGKWSWRGKGHRDHGNGHGNGHHGDCDHDGGGPPVPEPVTPALVAASFLLLVAARVRPRFARTR